MINKVQSGTNHGSSTSVVAQVTNPVTQGNLLVAVLDVNSQTTFTVPTGWTHAVVSLSLGSGAPTQIDIYWLLVDATNAGLTSWTWTIPNSHSWNTYLFEASTTNSWPANPLDQTGQGNNNGTTQATALTSGTTPATSVPDELWIAGIIYRGASQALSGITSGWTHDATVSTGTTSTLEGFYELPIVTGASGVSATIGTQEFWVGAVATFYENPLSPVSLGSTGGGIQASGSILAGGAVSSGIVRMGGAGDALMAGGVTVFSDDVAMGPRIPAGGLIPALARISYPTGHWVTVLVKMWRDNPRGSNTNFGWVLVPVKRWENGAAQILTPNQAGIETDLTGIQSNGTGVTLSRDTSTSHSGAASLKVVCDGSVARQGYLVMQPSSMYFEGGVVTVSCWLKVASGTPTIRMFLYWQDFLITPPVSAVLGASTPATLSTAWQQFTASGTLPAPLSATAQFGLRVDTNIAQAVTFWADDNSVTEKGWRLLST